MDQQPMETIREHLQKEDVQRRVQEYIHRGRSEATVSIGRAAHLFNFSENQLRDWEDHGLLNPLRLKGPKGQRQYSFTELDKLAIIRELLDAKFAPSDIPEQIDKLWYTLASLNGQHAQSVDRVVRETAREQETSSTPIDARVKQTSRSHFWRFYAIRALRQALLLVLQDMKDTLGVLVLPLGRREVAPVVKEPGDIAHLGTCLIGWMERDGSFYMFQAEAPTFTHETEFRLLELQAMDRDGPPTEPLKKTLVERPKDNTYILIQRDAKPLTLDERVVQVVRGLLTPLYEQTHEWQEIFNVGLNRSLEVATNFRVSKIINDETLHDLAEMVVHLGIRPGEQRSRWDFCCLLRPTDDFLPLQNQGLVVCAQTKNSPHTVDKTIVSPEKPIMGLSLRAYQSGRMLYRQHVTLQDSTIDYADLENQIRSAVAMPIGGEDGLPVGVLYVTSSEPNAFTHEDRCLLRFIGKMAEELLITHPMRQEAIGNLKDLLSKPWIIDTLFKDFPSEDGFVKDLEAQLVEIRADKTLAAQVPDRYQKIPHDPTDQDVLTFLAVDINGQTEYGSRYGDQVTRNLSRELGLRIRDRMTKLFARRTDWELYRIYADRYFLILKGISLQEACEKAAKLKGDLSGAYSINATRTLSEQMTSPRRRLEIPNVRVRLGITCYKLAKLYQVMLRYAENMPVPSTRALILHFLDIALDEGSKKGGDVIVSWDLVAWNLIVLPIPDSSKPPENVGV